jgi:uncharacterized membrane protein
MMRRDAIPEYVRSSLWVLPTLSVIVALIVGSALSLVNVGPDSPLAFQGTADDARALLIGITSTMVTVIALLLGLAVVALQLSSTQFSPRLLRNFLRDRPNQVVLSMFVGTFAYSAAGLFTVGVAGGERSTEFPRLAVTVAIGLMFVSLALLVFFADHLAHSIQVDAIMRVVERNTLAVIREGMFISGEESVRVPDGAVPVPARSSGYVQAVHVERLLSVARRHRISLRLRPRVGEHVVAGTTIAWMWPATPGEAAAETNTVALELDGVIRLGFERTFEQDAAFGIRQLCDVACKALSPGINDPYTAVQAIDHLAVILCGLAQVSLGDHQARDDGGGGVAVVIPGWRFSQYLAVACGLIRRYGSREPTVTQALLRMLGACAVLVSEDPRRWAAIEQQAGMIVAPKGSPGQATDADQRFARSGRQSGRQPGNPERLRSCDASAVCCGAATPRATDAAAPRPHIGPLGLGAYGVMFWLTWNRLPGSYFRLASTRRP